MYIFMFLIWQLWRADIISFRSWSLATIFWKMLYNGKDHLKASKTIQSKKCRYFSKLANFLLLFRPFSLTSEQLHVSHLLTLLPCCSAAAFEMLELPMAVYAQYYFSIGNLLCNSHCMMLCWCSCQSVQWLAKASKQCFQFLSFVSTKAYLCKPDCTEIRSKLSCELQQRWETCSNSIHQLHSTSHRSYQS